MARNLGAEGGVSACEMRPTESKVLLVVVDTSLALNVPPQAVVNRRNWVTVSSK